MNQNEVENELKHWGILGMHWGIRRYQNPDGSLPPEGRERYLKKTEQIIKDENTNLKITNKAISKLEDALDDLNKEFEKKVGWMINLHHMQKNITNEPAKCGISYLKK